MKTTLLFSCFFYLVSFTSFSQTSASVPPENNKKEELPLYNLYYLSKYIGSENLSNNQINLLYKGLLANSNKEEKDLNSTIKNDKSNRYIVLKKFLDEIELKNNKVKDDIDFLLTNGRFDDFKERYNNDYTTTKLDSLRNTYDSLLQPEKLKVTNDKKEILNKLKTSINNNDINSINELKAQLLNLDPNIVVDPNLNSDNLEVIIKKNSDEIDSNNKNIILFKKQIEKIKNEIISKIKNSKYTPVSYSTTYIDSKVVSTEIILNSAIQTSEQRAATSSYKLPSESDMINAMAIFLAKRAQQETAIWFMDKIRENIKNPLVYEAFPETIKLIESLEDFKTPNFSMTWRYAIASDFVKMPENLSKSAWVQNFIFEGDSIKIENFSKAVTFGYDLNRLVAEKYNYRDIIRYFYTHPDYDKIKTQIIMDADNKLKMNELLKNSITILYILTNEFFAIDEINNNKNYRLLSYEEINGMTKIQWQALGELIQLKYGSDDANFDMFFKDNSKKDKLSKWIGNLLISLSQFDKVNKDFQKASEKKENDPNFNFYNVWQNTLQIIDNLDYKKYFNTSIQTNKDYIEILKQSITIYENIQNKNYPEAIQKTLEIVDKLKLLDKVNTHLQIYYDTTQFNYQNGQFYFAISGVQYFLKTQNQIKDQNLYIVKNQTDTICTLENYIKISPFLKFVDPNKKNENYELIKSIDPNFDKNINQISEFLGIKNSTVIFMLKSFILINDTKQKRGEVDKQQLLNSLIRSQFKFVANNTENNEQTRIKQKYQDQLLKLTSFFGDVLVAKNSEELANVLDSHALPPTSYKLKRRVSRSIDLNGYVGLQGSRMWTNGFTSLKTQYTLGITAPIGFAYTWSTLKRDKPNNWGITIDLVDLGNIVNHYLVNSTNDYTKDVHFSEVFSPAASFMYALRKTPFVVFASFKLLPLKTSNITTADGNQTLINEKAFDASVFSVGFKIDIPLVNLWSKVK